MKRATSIMYRKLLDNITGVRDYNKNNDKNINKNKDISVLK
jgi:hypothetical protein